MSMGHCHWVLTSDRACDGYEILEAYLRATDALFFLIDRDGKYLDFRASESIPTYVEPDLFLGRRISDILPEPTASRCLRAVREVLDTRNAQLVEYELAIASEMHRYEARIVPNGVNVVVAVRDITEIKKREEEPRDAWEHFRALFENISEPIEVSCRGKVVFVNAAYLELFGYHSATELSDRPTSLMVAPASRPLVSWFEAARDAGKSIPTVFRMQGVRKDGTVIDVESCVSRYERCGEVYQAAVIHRVTPGVRPGTRRRQVGEEMQQAVETGLGDVPPDPSSIEAEAGSGLKFSPREMQVLQMIAQGKATKEIANALEISVKTAGSHRTHIMAKLGVHDVVSLLRLCVRAGLVQL